VASHGTDTVGGAHPREPVAPVWSCAARTSLPSPRPSSSTTSRSRHAPERALHR